MKDNENGRVHGHLSYLRTKQKHEPEETLAFVPCPNRMKPNIGKGAYNDASGVARTEESDSPEGDARERLRVRLEC